MTDKTSNSCFLVLFPPPVFLSLPPVSLLEEALRQWKQLGRWWRIWEPFPRWSRQSQPINRLRPPQLSRDTWKVLPLDTAPHFNIDFIIDNLANINVDISRYQNQQPQPTFFLLSDCHLLLARHWHHFHVLEFSFIFDSFLGRLFEFVRCELLRN